MDICPPFECCRELEVLLKPSLFKALCDPNRLGILCSLVLKSRPTSVSELADESPVDVSVVSRHLAMLRDVDILQAEKRGKAVFYSVRFHELACTFRTLADAIEACCPKEVSNDNVGE